MPPILSAFASTSETSFPLVTTTVPKSLAAFMSVMLLFAPTAARVVVPNPMIAPDCVIAPVAAVSPMAPVPTDDIPGPRFTAPAVLINAPPLFVLKVRLVTATSMALLPPAAPMPPAAFLALRFRLAAVIVRPVVLPSVNDPALRVTVLAPKLTALPMVMAPVLAATSPITIEPTPVTPPAKSVTSVAFRSKAEAPANDIAVPAVNGLSVSTPVV